MAKYKRIVTTEAGLSLLAKAYESETTIMFTAVKTGNGIYDGTEDLSGATALKSVKQSFGLSGVSRTGAQVKVRSVVSNNGATAGYDITEIGLYAKDPDSAEVLYAIIVAETGLEDYLPPYEETPTSITLEMYIAIAEEQSKVTFTAEVVAGTYVAVGDFQDHAASTSNPHGVTKSQVGLGSVPNVATNDQTPTYTAATQNAALTSGEKLSVAFGKIAKAISSLISHLADKISHITAEERTAWNSAKDIYATILQSTSNKELTLQEINKPTDDMYGYIREVTAEAIGLPRIHFSVISRYNSGNSTQLFLPIADMNANPWVRNMSGTTIVTLFELTRRQDIIQYLALTGGIMAGNIDMNGHRIIGCAGTYASSLSEQYSHSCLEIREKDLITTESTDLGYAPTIGFHWGGTVGAAILMDTNGDFHFVRGDGAYSTLKTAATNVIASDKDPTDTTAVWVDTTNMKLKIYKNGSWTALS